MAWQKKNTAQHSEVLDLRTGMHLIPLIEPDSGAEHKLQITVGHDACPHCGHVIPKTNLGDLDVPAIIEAEIKALNDSHANMHAYATKHGVKVRKVVSPVVAPAAAKQFGGKK